MAYLIGVDIGGTFTDVICRDEETGEVVITKVATTPADPSLGLLKAVKLTEKPLEEIALIVHGTTIATNAVIQRKGARCALITTKGFRDVLELGYRDRLRNYGVTGTQNPIIPRELRFEVTERILADGSELKPLDEGELGEIAKKLKFFEVEAVSVCLLHSYINDSHEKRVKAVLEGLGNWPIVLSSEVMREYYEFERTSTTVLTTYLRPLMTGYAGALSKRLLEGGYKGEVLYMQSNGGVLGSSLVGEYAAHTIRSGPAAGIIAATALMGRLEIKDAISADMGGTSFDVCLISDGKPRMVEESLLDFRVPLRTPMIEVHTIGAGGGSIAWIDRSNILRVGPQSAGSDPGPVCYGRGNTEPTVTDANLVLGRIDPGHVIGTAGEISLDRDRAEKYIMERIGQPLGLSKEQAALAIIRVVNANIEGRIRLISIERGYDPRRFAMIAYGGAGPLHAGAIMKHMSLQRCVIPPWPGVFCAVGCAMADIRHDFVQTVDKGMDDLSVSVVDGIVSEHQKRGAELLEQERVSLIQTNIHVEADMMYAGQRHAITVPFRSLTPDMEKIKQWFYDRYTYIYGGLLTNVPIHLLNIRTTVMGVRQKLEWEFLERGREKFRSQAVKGSRQVFFEDSWTTATVYDRLSLPLGEQINGPAIIEQRDTTTLVPPDMVAAADNLGNLILEVRHG